MTFCTELWYKVGNRVSRVVTTSVLQKRRTKPGSGLGKAKFIFFFFSSISSYLVYRLFLGHRSYFLKMLLIVLFFGLLVEFLIRFLDLSVERGFFYMFTGSFVYFSTSCNTQ